jgi:NTE family protein
MSLDPFRNVFGPWSHIVSIPGGQALARPGQPVAALYRVVAGRIGELRPGADGGSQLIAVHHPGALIGGLEALEDGLHHTELVALRDSELRALPIRRAARLLKRDPHILADVARSALSRVGAQPGAAGVGRASILGFVGLTPAVRVADIAQSIAVGLRERGCRIAVVGAEAGQPDAAHLSRLEEANDHVFLAAEHGETEFADYCARQIDRLVLFAAPDTTPDAGPDAARPALGSRRLVDVVIVHPPDVGRPQGMDAWISGGRASRLIHIRSGDAGDLLRLGRMYSGRSVGLVLSGGGARAYAHVGVIRALAEMGVPIDLISGTSMGAVVGAGLAMGWPLAELDERLRDAFVDSSPLSDIAVPLLAMTHGREVETRLQRHFGEVEIADLWRPFACVSTDLTAGGQYVHSRGLLRQALRASLSLPGVLPPVVIDGHVLVDGALVANFPADLVTARHDGRNIGVDVGQADGLRPQDLELKPGGLSWLTTGAWLKGPPIVAVLIRAATVASEASVAAIHKTLDVVIEPDVNAVDLQDWKAFAPAVDAGYRAALAHGDQLSKLAG